MVFNSYIFILFFLPIVVGVYFFINRKEETQKSQKSLVWLLGASFVFYAYNLPVFLGFLILSIWINYKLGKQLNCYNKRTSNNEKGKWVLTLGIILNLLPLIGFKYTNFILAISWDLVYTKWHWNITHPLDIAVPLGISFFTFMQLAYLVDCYRGEKEIDYTLLEYASYVAFFPKIAMGPIALHDEIIPQFRDRTKKRINYDNLSRGLYVFALGLAKKVLIADVLAKIVNGCYDKIYFLNSMTAIVVMVCYTLQIYFDFSGYCDMAMGVAKMINIELPMNFNSPYKAKSISEFWDRWHMTLTRFFTRYVYIPLGGSRKGKIRTYINTMLVFLISGLWHGADWGFVIWGALHGVLMVIEKIWKDLGLGFRHLSGVASKVVDGLRWAVTFIVINITWMFFRAGSLYFVRQYFGKLFAGGWEVQTYVTDVVNELIELRILKRFGLENLLEASMDVTIWGFVLLLILAVVCLKNTQEKEIINKYHWKRGLLTVLLLVWSIVSLSDVSEFLYFDF